MYLVENWQFFHTLNIGEIAQQNVLENVLEREKAFPGYKNNTSKKSKILHFSKVVCP